jgi:hypothetical protein
MVIKQMSANILTCLEGLSIVCMHFISVTENYAVKLDLNLRGLKKSRLVEFCYAPATTAASSKGIFAPATDSTDQTNKAGGTCH